MTYHIGSALSYVLGAGGTAAPFGVGGALNAAGGGGSDVQSSADAGHADASPAASSSGVSGAAQPSARAGGANAGVATSNLSGSPTSNAARRASPALFARDLRSTTRWFYAVLAIGGAALLFAAALWRRKGVQATWLS